MLTRWAMLLGGAVCAVAGCAGRSPSPDSPPTDGAAAVAPVAERRIAIEWVLQARTGAQGGNESIVSMGDSSSWRRIDGPSEHELDFASPPATRDRATAYVRRESIPSNLALVIDAIDVYASAAGDSNGHGCVDVRVGTGSLLRLENDARPVLQWFSGRTVVRAGREGDVSAHLANSSAVDVRVHGHLEPVDGLLEAFDEPFVPTTAPTARSRAGGDPAGTHGVLLAQPAAWLQLRSGAGGGNPNRVDLTGRKSVYVRDTSREPLSFATPPSMRERSVAYVDGGLVPPGKVFVVTRIDYAGSAKGDSNGHGEMIVSVKGVRVVSARDQAEPIRGTWTGRIEIASGEEGTVLVEIANSSTADVRIRGEFADAVAAAR